MIVRETNHEDVEFVAENMRKADLDELQAAGTPNPHESLLAGLKESKPCCYSGVAQGNPVAICGVVPIVDSPNFGSIWLLGTDHITDSVPISFLKKSREFFPTLVEPYDMVSNIVDKRNEVHVKWIKWLGFSFMCEIIYGPENRPFYEFARLT